MVVVFGTTRKKNQITKNKLLNRRKVEIDTILIEVTVAVKVITIVGIAVILVQSNDQDHRWRDTD